MKFVLLTISCFLLSVAASSIDEQWTSFKKEHNKKYTNAREETTRFTIFKDNMKEIEEHNAKYANGEFTYSLRVNQFGDMSLKEFTTKFTGYKLSPPKNTSLFRKFTYPSDANLPTYIDWREKGGVTPVKNQGTCNGCWSFSATGAMEGQLFRSTGKLVSLSEQQLIDCSREYGNLGCNGGIMDETYRYIKDVGGVMSEDSYPFLGMDGLCNFAPKSIVNGTKVVSFTNLPIGDEQTLKAVVATIGPVSVAVAAANHKFMFYDGGILTNQGCGPELDHAVLVVGYGTSKGTNEDYWIVKNSWSTKWGEKGYIRIARNKMNTCGLATFPVYPVLEQNKNDDKSTTPPSPTSLTPVTLPTPSTTPSGAWRAVLSSRHLLIPSLCFVYASIKI